MKKRGLGWFIFPTENFRKIAEKIKELIKNPEKIDAKKQNFKKAEKEIFSERKVTNALLELLQEPS